ncbi:hypothetical protein U2100_15380, partial [Listeria monocytogenes]|uniref:hypothetical protein n=1 Tax=Listeria monocytogenes TaxID=1639 RepID=UPI002FDBEA86
RARIYKLRSPQKLRAPQTVQWRRRGGADAETEKSPGIFGMVSSASDRAAAEGKIDQFTRK